jgi:DUF4097 and DUF4098 domain-containing protein YvlB
MTSRIFLISALICFLSGAAHARQCTFLSSQVKDIFITTQRADINVSPAANEEQTAINWRSKHCNALIITHDNGVVEISVTPKRQHVFFKKLLGVKTQRCKINLQTAQNKNIYASSEIGSIRFNNIAANNSKVYTTEGIIEVNNYSGNLSAETLTGRITGKNITARTLNLKTASGNINFTGNINNADILNTSGTTRLNGELYSLNFYSSEGDLYAKWHKFPQNPLKIRARSFSGDIKLTFPKQTDLYDGKNDIFIKSFYGAAHILN